MAVKAKKPARPQAGPCIDGSLAHHFVVEPVDGSLNGGACIKCGLTKTWPKHPIEEFTVKTPRDRRLAEER